MKKGFTLVESIISVVLIAIIGIGMFSAFSAVQYMFDRTRRRTQAFNFSREVYHRLRANYGYNDSQLNEGTHGDPETETGVVVKGEIANLLTDFKYDVAEEPTGGYKEVTVTFEWNEVI